MRRRLLLCLGIAIFATCVSGALAIGFTELLQFVLLRFGDVPAFLLVCCSIGAYLGFWGFALTCRSEPHQ